MSCAERQRLFDLYFYRVTNYDAVVRQMHARGTGSTAERQMLVEAKKAAERARIELQRHDLKHGCRASTKCQPDFMLQG